MVRHAVLNDRRDVRPARLRQGDVVLQHDERHVVAAERAARRREDLRRLMPARVALHHLVVGRDVVVIRRRVRGPEGVVGRRRAVDGLRGLVDAVAGGHDQVRRDEGARAEQLTLPRSVADADADGKVVGRVDRSPLDRFVLLADGSLCGATCCKDHGGHGHRAESSEDLHRRPPTYPPNSKNSEVAEPSNGLRHKWKITITERPRPEEQREVGGASSPRKRECSSLQQDVGSHRRRVQHAVDSGRGLLC